jgi:hypothetical protein
MKKIFVYLFAMGLVLSCSKEAKDYQQKINDPQRLHLTVKKVTDVIVHDIFSPPVAARIYAYMSIAAYEAARFQDSSYVSLAGQLNDFKPGPTPKTDEVYSFSLASIQAAFKVGRTLVFSEDKMDAYYKELMKEIDAIGIPSDVVDRSIEFGNAVADHVLLWSSKDNYKQSRSFPKYTILTDDSTWKPTPPAYMDAVEPHWNKIRTFAIDSAAQFKPRPPTPFSLKKESAFYKEAIEVYEVGKNLSDEQREIASFWDCNPFAMNVRGHVMFATKKISPGGHWMNITRLACNRAKADFVASTEAYVIVAISLVDGFIRCWDEKYRSKVIRPETYINQHIDENWVPLLQTPPFPEYTSGHSVISSAAASVLTGLFGDNFSYTDSTEVEFGMPVRSFTSFRQAADEAAISRMYGGIHYRLAVEVGATEGKALGDYIIDKITTRKRSIAHAK